MSYQEIEENPEDGTSGLTSASQIMDSTSVDPNSEIQTTGIEQDGWVFVKIPIPGTTRKGMKSSIPDDEFQEAVEKAFRAAVEGETVLLSPACASFDMFDNYAQRGNRFREIVERLG